MQNHLKTNLLIVGAGAGGCAAALAAADLGCRVILTEPTDWIGGQLTSQAVPPDENGWIEGFGATRRYRRFRDGVRNYYRQHFPLTQTARQNPHLNPGQGTVSRLCHEPRIGVAVLEAMLAPHRSSGRITLLHHREPIAVEVNGDRAAAVTLRHLQSGQTQTIAADYILDATELGDLLPLAKTEYVSGAESRADTGEPHAAQKADPDNVQSFTWCFAMAYDPDGNHVIDHPVFYEKWRDYTPQLEPAWCGKMLSWSYCHPHHLRPITRVLLPQEATPEKSDLWRYRRLIAAEHYPADIAPHEATLVNWPQNDYWEGNIIDKPAALAAKYLEESRQLSLSFFYWLQTEAPRPDGGRGYPGLCLRPDITGTDDGLAMAPYIRESRRVKALFTVTENHVGLDARRDAGFDRAESFPDSVGIGYYRIDLHPSAGHTNYIDIPSLPFQIPLGSLIPVRMENLLPACKNLGVTHITNGCYRLHPVEWTIGESAGLLAAFCLQNRVPPRAVHHTPALLESFQKLLVHQGIELAWPPSIKL
jgi:hypothetical protein